MIDIVQYRCQIGLFGQKIFSKKFLFKQEFYETASWNKDQSGDIALLSVKFIFKFILLSVLLTPPAWSSPPHLTSCCTSLCTGTTTDTWLLASSQVTTGAGYGWAGGRGIRVALHVGRETGNFWAKYVNGNIRGAKGVHNMHFKIRSLKFKVGEIKNIIHNERPTLLGLSDVS